MNHADMVAVAVSWLKRSPSRGGPGCHVALSEIKNGFKRSETPDAIGFRAGVHDEGSILIEVKTSRADFLADKHKPFRMNPEKGIGLYRYFMTPPGMLAIEELPEKWGLIEVAGSKRPMPKVVFGHHLLKLSRTGKSPFRFDSRNTELEVALLTRTLMRVGDPEQLNKLLKQTRANANRVFRRNEQLETLLRRHQLNLCQDGVSVIPHGATR